MISQSAVYDSLISQVSEEWKPFMRLSNVQDMMQDVARHLARNILKGVTMGPDISCIFRIFTVTDPSDIDVVILTHNNDRVYDSGHRAYVNNGIAHSTVRTAVKSIPASKLQQHITVNYENASIPDHGDLTEMCVNGVFIIPIYWTCMKVGDKYEPHVFWKMFTIALLEYIYEINSEKKPIIVFAGTEPRKLWEGGSLKKCKYEMVFTPSLYSSDFVTSSMIREIDTHRRRNGQTPIDWDNIMGT